MSKYKRILSVLEKINQLFLECQVVNFQKVIEEYIATLDKAYVIPADKINEMRLTFFGGMGSLNDVIISKDNYHAVENEDKVNKKLDALREQLKIAWKEEFGNLR